MAMKKELLSIDNISNVSIAYSNSYAQPRFRYCIFLIKVIVITAIYA